MPTPLESKVTQQVDVWKRRLLDLTRRNRLLNFRPTPRSTITIVDERSAEVFRTLWLEKRAMRFQPGGAADAAAAPPNAPAAPPNAPAAPQEAAAAPEPAPPPDGEDGETFRAYDVAGLPERHRDDRLQTRLDRNQLERSLRYVQQQAKSAMEEQGVGTLFLALGMLHYRPVEPSDELQCAPVLLLEVDLEPAGRGRLPTLVAAGEDPIVNPTLAEYLRRFHAVELPEPEELDDPIAFFAQVQECIAKFPDWALREEIHLGLFAFQKLVMFKDLERNAATFVANPLAQRLCDPAGGVPPALPADVAALDLDAAFPPEVALIVRDADASQLRAIAAVGRGHDLVVEGPPGTGKSQTIANLIAQAIGAGRSVLFVSEKMAALEVVFRRLEEAGLADFCFELHSQKARRGPAIAGLARAWQAALAPDGEPDGPPERLIAARAALSEYAHQLHEPFGALGWSPFRAIGELERVRNAPPWRWPGSAREQDERALDDARAALEAWSAAAASVGDPRTHAWRHTTQEHFGADALDDLHARLRESLAALEEWGAAADEVVRTTHLPLPRTIEDAATATAFAELLARRPALEPGVLAQPEWGEAAPGLPEQIVATLREVTALAGEASARFVPEVQQAALVEDIAIVRRLSRHWDRLLHAEYRAVRARWRAWRRPDYTGTLAAQADHFERVVALQASRAWLRQHDADGARLFGAAWRLEASDDAALGSLAGWLREFLPLCARHGFGADARALALATRAETRAIAMLAECTRRCAVLARTLFDATAWRPEDALAEPGWGAPADGERTLSLPLLAESLAALEHDFARAGEWCAFLRGRAAAAAAAGPGIVEAALDGALPFATLAASYARAFLRRWLDEAIAERSRLRDFDSELHERALDEFRRLDREVHELNRRRITATLRQRAQQALSEPALSPQVGALRREIGRKARFQPLRKTIAQAFEAIRAIKPCFLMSPLTVAQCLDPQAHRFDLVIFDEASQLTPEDAIGAIIRGERLVVTGDQKQLPPTNFFTLQTEQAEEAGLAEGDGPLDDSESILELCQRSSFPSATLRWHYRSRHESLITFSNQSFYDGALLTFPSADTDRSVRGLQFTFVPEGRYEGSGENPREAARVVDAIAGHAARWAADPERSPTLGVGTFNVRQQMLVLDLLAERRKADAALDDYLSHDREHGFFVKNLENIQGDDRDVILLSVTYGRNEDGRVRLNFGPINGENGWRRLNVLVTRARSVMRVFASMHADDIDTASETLGVKLLRKFLRYAETGVLEDRKDDAAAQVESPFEGQVRMALEARGYAVVSQVGAAGYRIDLAIKDPASPGRYVCGIECDGASWHSSETARDRDRLRQQILEDLGWTIHRVWSTDWFKDRARQLDRVCRLIDASRTAATRGAAHAPAVAAPAPAPASAVPPAAAPPAPLPAAPDPPPGVAAALPSAAPYVLAKLARPAGAPDFHAAPLDLLGRLAVQVVAAEGPVHDWDVTVRLADCWELQRVGSQIESRVARALDAACRAGTLTRDGEFLALPGAEVRVRSRAETGIPIERIAPAEVQAALREVLHAVAAAPREELIALVRARLGYQRTGPRIESRIGDAIAALLAARAIAEGPHGLCLLG